MRCGRDTLINYPEQFEALLSTYFAKGGSQAMITVVNRGDLEKAMVEPEKYKDVFVRVGGFSARFVDLPKDVQVEILSRTTY
jgi:pyruvate-formate lyase